MTQFAGFVAKYPSRVLFSWFLGLIVLGTLLLLLPASRAPDAAPISFSDAAFTATSASCVTGLIVRSTPNDFSFFGQAVILSLIQLGGLGITTIATMFFISITGKSLPEQDLVAQQTLGVKPDEELKNLLPKVLVVVLLVELVAAIVLTLRVWSTKDPLDAIWWGTFHSISAYCNGGFALQDDSLCSYVGDPVVNLTVMVLILAGGIGYPVLRDIYRAALAPWGGKRSKLTFHTRFTLSASLIILAASIAAVWLLERNHLLRDMPTGTGWLAAAFQAVTTRTAGFNTVPLSELTNATLFIMTVLMLIGANSCSTGGGMKVSTISVLIMQLIAELRGKPTATLFRSRIAPSAVNQAIIIVVAYVLAIVCGLSLVLVFQQAGQPQTQDGAIFRDAFFEVVSAISTAGVSTGLTGQLEEPSRWVIMTLMFAGRIGPLTLVAALAKPSGADHDEYPVEEPYIG